jgi:N-formylglutamate amidohydrolase
MFRHSMIPAPLVLLACLLSSPGYGEERTPADLVAVQQGTLPIILTVPHGGREAIPGIAPRNLEGKPKGGKWGGFVGGGDLNTDILAQRIAAEIKALTGKDVYFVMAKFERKFVDANRPPEIALDSPAARPYYDLYHGSIRGFVGEIRRKYPAGLLIDVHGESDNPAVLMRGTRNGLTIARLLQRAGAAAVTGPKGIFGQLQSRGFTVYPDNALPVGGTSENGGLNGGYTVAIYGSNTPDGIDAIQFEFGKNYREMAVLDKSASDAAAAIAAFYDAYLKNARKQ